MKGVQFVQGVQFLPGVKIYRVYSLYMVYSLSRAGAGCMVQSSQGVQFVP